MTKEGTVNCKNSTMRLERASLLFGGAIAVIAIILGIACMRYPFDIDPMEDSSYGTVYHLIHTVSVYSQPSLSFTANIYPPFYFMVCALVGKVFGLSFLALRFVSAFSAVIGCVAIFSIIRRETGLLSLSLLGVFLFICTFGMASGCYVLGRVDTLAVSLLLVSITLIRRGWAVRAALVLVLCCITKQTYIVAALCLLLTQIYNTRRFLVFFSTFAALLTATVLCLQRWSGGWFLYYVWSVPAHKRPDMHQATHFLVRDVGAFLPTLIIFAVVAFTWIDAEKRHWTVSALPGRAYLGSLIDRMFFPVVLFGCFASAALNRTPTGGATNTVVPLWAILCVCIPLATAQFLKKYPRSLYPGAALCSQFAILGLFFVTVLPPSSREQIIGCLFDRIRLEAGPTLIVTRSSYPVFLGVTSATLTNNGGVVDASSEPWGIQNLMRSASTAIANKQFSIVVLDLDDHGGCAQANTQWLPADFLSNYRLSEALEEPTRTLLRRRKEDTPGCIFVPTN